MMPDISISYHNKKIADEVRAAFNGTPLYCKQSLGYKGSLKSHREKVGKSDCIVLIVCDDYLKSSECLAELLAVYENGSFQERIFPIVLNGVELRNSHYLLNHLRGVEAEIQQLEKAMRQVNLYGQTSIQNDLDLLVKKRSCLSEIISTFKGIYIPEIESLIENNYKEIVEEVSQHLSRIKGIAKEETKDSKKISEEKMYLCNRKDQFGTFLNALQDQKKINSFYIHGDEMHGHDAMFERFCNDLRGSYRTNERNRKEIKTLHIYFSTMSATSFRLVLLTKFLNALGMNLHQYTPANPIVDEKLHHVCQKSNYIKPLKSNDIIAINFRIPGGEWFPGLTDEIEWFINDFCTGKLPDDTPTFHFFFSVVYSRTNLIKQPLRFRKLKRHKENIIKALRNTFIPDINELTWVKPDDVRDWLSIIGIENSDKRNQLMATKFKKDTRQGYYMSELKKTLKTVINDHANNKL